MSMQWVECPRTSPIQDDPRGGTDKAIAQVQADKSARPAMVTTAPGWRIPDWSGGP